MNKKILFTICSIVLLFLYLQNEKCFCESDDIYLEHLAGNEYPIACHYYSKIPDGFIPNIWNSIYEYSGLYKGESHYAGDRRYGAFNAFYTIKVRVQARFDIRVEWNCKYQSNKNELVKDEIPEMGIENIKYGSSNIIWGDMYFISDNNKKIITNPFIAVFVIRQSDHAPGMLLFGRYEGNVFLPMIK